MSNLRSLADFARTIPTTYVSGITAYSTYIFQVSQSPRHSIEAFQILIFALFPLFPVIQLLDNFVQGLVRLALSNQSSPLIWTNSPWQYVLLGLCGDYVRAQEGASLQWLERQRIFDARPELLQLRKEKWTLPKVGVVLISLATLTLSVLSLANYIYRNVAYEWAGVIQLDHRIGWAAIGVIATSFMTLIKQICNASFTISISQDEYLQTNTIWDQKHIFPEIFVAMFVHDLLLDLVLHRYSISWIRLLGALRGDILSTALYILVFVGVLIAKNQRPAMLLLTRLKITAARFFSQLSTQSSADEKARHGAQDTRSPLRIVVLLVGLCIGLCVPIFEVVGDVREAIEINHNSKLSRSFFSSTWQEPDLPWPGL